MTTKTLKTIQTISKIGKIFSTIVFIFSIIGFVGCIVGMIGLAVIPDGGFKIGGVTIRGLVETNAGISMGTAYTSMAIAVIFCAGEAVLAKFAGNYFKHELEAGTPFTFEGAKEMLRLGILAICIPAATSTVAAITYAIMSSAIPDVDKIDFSNAFSIGLGIMFIITSLICKHGAEVTQKTDPDQNAVG